MRAATTTESTRNVAVLVSDAEGTIVAQNEHAEVLFGPQVGEPCAKVMGTLGAPPCDAHLRAQAGREARVTELRVHDHRYLLCCAPGVECHVAALIGALEPTERWEHPTPREMEVLRLVAAGLDNPRIADRLGIAHRTVSSHVENLRTKLGVPSRAALVARAYRMQLL